MKITQFAGDHGFLSNTYPSKIIFRGLLFHNNTAAFNAQKIVNDVTVRQMLQSMTPSEQVKFKKALNHVFLADEVLDSSVKVLFTHLDPADAETLGRAVKLRKDWTLIRDNIMYEVCLAKFEQNLDLLESLLDTKDTYLEDDFVNSRYWGVRNGRGKNKVGLILMSIRESFKTRAWR